jgi:predicted NBD/HSP70 family sugar kinase
MQGISKNPKEQRRENAYLVLNVIRKHEGISRKDIADITGLSIPSVTKIVNYLSEIGLLSYFMGLGKNQRKIPFYTFRSDKYAVLGLEFSRTKNVGIVSDLQGTILGRCTIEPISSDYEQMLTKTANELQKLIDTAKKAGMKILGLGIGSPGPIDSYERKLINPPGFYDWKDIYLGEDFENKLKIPVYLEKGTDTSALAEKILGKGRDRDEFIYVEIGEGIGSSIIYNNKIFRGNSKVYSSLGHTTVVVDGPVCECGSRGCLEMYTRESIVLEKLEKAASAEQKKEVFRETAQYLAAGISNLVLVTGIETVIIGGELIIKYDELFSFLNELIPQWAFPSLKRDIKIERSKLMEDDIAIGGALWVAESALLNIDILNMDRTDQKSIMQHEIVIS